MVVLPEAHPLCVKEKIEIENLENEPFMLSEHGGIKSDFSVLR